MLQAEFFSESMRPWQIRGQNLAKRKWRTKARDLNAGKEGIAQAAAKESNAHRGMRTPHVDANEAGDCAKLAQAFHNRAGIESQPRAKLPQDPGKWYRGRPSHLISKPYTNTLYGEGSVWEISSLGPAQWS